MNIGIMLRALGERQGVGIYSQNLVDHLVSIDQENRYFLYYRDAKFLGRYASRSNVVERLVRAPNKVIWDQIQIPLYALRDKIDVLFHTKFSIPLLSPVKTVMSLHGAGWFVHPELFKWHSVLYQRWIMPLYCWKAGGLLANSNLTKSDFVRILRLDPDKIRTIYLAADDRFRPLAHRAKLAAVRTRYGLPQRFILSVIKHDPRKNFCNLIEAFRLCRERADCKLVVAGIGCEKYRDEYRLREIGLEEHVTFLGWVEQEDLVALYNLAEFLFFPSLYETFGIPVCEAISCGLPVVIARTGSLPEIAGDAGVAVNPRDPAEMAQALYSLWTNEALRQSYVTKAYARSKAFSWSRSAAETREVFDAVACGKALTASDPMPFVRSRLEEVRSGSSD